MSCAVQDSTELLASYNLAKKSRTSPGFIHIRDFVAAKKRDSGSWVYGHGEGRRLVADQCRDHAAVAKAKVLDDSQALKALPFC